MEMVVVKMKIKEEMKEAFFIIRDERFKKISNMV
jgi:hypothetical protein